jgi:hypothetical protein
MIILCGRKNDPKNRVCLYLLITAFRIFLNLLNGGVNKKNVQSLEDYIRNEVYKLCSDEEIKLNL